MDPRKVPLSSTRQSIRSTPLLAARRSSAHRNAPHAAHTGTLASLPLHIVPLTIRAWPLGSLVQVAKLKGKAFVEALQANPLLLYTPPLAFAKQWLESLGECPPGFTEPSAAARLPHPQALPLIVAFRALQALSYRTTTMAMATTAVMTATTPCRA